MNYTGFLAYFLFSVLLIATGIFLIRKKNSFLNFIFLFLLYLPIFAFVRYEWNNFAIYRGETLYVNDVVYINKNDPVVDPERSKPEVFQEYKDSFEFAHPQDAFLNISSRLYFIFFSVLFFFVSFYSQGGLILKLIKYQERSLLEIALKIGLGAFFSSLTMFFLAKFSFLTIWPISIFFILPIILSVKTLYKSFKHYLGLELNLVFAFVLILVSVWNFIEIAEPLPGGFDDYNLYLNLANLLSEHGTFLHNLFPYAFTLLQAAALILFSSYGIAKGLILGFSLLSLIPLYFICKKYLNERSSLMFVLVFYTIPSILMHSYLQTKLEMAIFFFGTISILYFVYWLEERRKMYLIFAALFVAFAFTIKITAVILIAAMLTMLILKVFGKSGFVSSILILIYVYFYSGLVSADMNDGYFLSMILLILLLISSIFVLNNFLKSKQKVFLLKEIIIFLSVLFLVTAPWFASNLLSNKPFDLKNIVYDYSSLSPKLDIAYPKSCVSNGASVADYGLYDANREDIFQKLFFLPWDLSMDISAKSILTNIGFIFLAFIPLFVLLIKKRDHDDDAILIVGASIFFVLWILLAKNVIWYGISGFAFLILILVLCYQKLEGNLKKFTNILLIISISAGVFLRGNLFFSRTPFFMPYLSGLASEEDFISYQYPNLLIFTEILNQDLNSKIFLANDAVLNFFIKNNNSRVYNDQYFDSLACLFVEKDDDIFLKRLKSSQFDYLVYSSVTDAVYEPYMRKNIDDITTFAKKNLQLIVTDNKTYIFKINHD